MLRTFLSGLIAATLYCIQAHAQNSHHHGHSQWHEGFYKNLMRKDTKTSCCNLNDCRPTESRMVDDRYEVLVDGEWIKADQSVIQNLIRSRWRYSCLCASTSQDHEGQALLRGAAAGGVRYQTMSRA